MDRFFENKRAVIASVVALGAVGFAGYYLLSGEAVPNTDATDLHDSKRPNNVKRKKNKKKSAKKTGPLSHGFHTTQDSPDGSWIPVIDDWKAVAQLKEHERKELGEEFKVAGNTAFNNKNYDRALELYNMAIKAYDKDAVFYSNRAAVWGSWKNYENVVKDTTEGLKLRPDYVKCYARRAVAYENLKNYQEAVMDFTSACILENFRDDASGQSVDRVLRLEAEKRVSEIDGGITKEFASANFIRAYLQSFHKVDLPDSVIDAEENTAEYKLKLAFDAIDKENQESYKQAVELIEQSIEQGFKHDNAAALAYEFLGTFESLNNENEKAMKSINRSIELNPTVPAYLKRSAIHIESGDLKQSDQDFEQARKLNPDSADLYYQLAQVEFLQQQWSSAITNYTRSLELDPSFILAHVQLAVTEYRMDRIEESKKRFQELIKKFPDDSQGYNYYGEILLDLKEVPESLEMFTKAIEIETSKSTACVNVLPLVNKAMALMQRAQGPEDVEKALEYCEKAVTIDPQSDVAVGALAQFNLQMGKTNEAIELFEKNAQLARTVPEQIQALTFAEAARTQNRIMQERPIVRERLDFLGKSRRG